MFYIYMIIGIIISSFLAAIVYFVPFLIVREFDKMTFIKGYTKEMKWLKVLKYISVVMGSILLLGGLSILIIIILIFKIKNKGELKLIFSQATEVIRVMIISPIVGIGLTFLLISLINKLLYFLEWSLVASLFDTTHYAILLIIIPYYLILAIKASINCLKAENTILKKDYSEFKDEDTSKKEWLKRVIASPRLEEYKENYLKVYNTQEEWKRSDYSSINYNWYYKLLFIVLVFGAFLNVIVSFIENDILDMNIITSQGLYFSYFLIIIILLNWTFNGKLLVSIIKVKKITINILVKFIMLLVITLIIFLNCWESIYYKLAYEPIFYNYNEYKQTIVQSVSTRKNYLEYDTYQKINYIYQYHQFFGDDVESLGYKPLGDARLFCIPIKDDKISTYMETNYYTLTISKNNLQIFNKDCQYEGYNIKSNNSVIKIVNNKDFYRYDSEERAKEFEAEYGRTYVNLANDDVEKIMKEEAVKAIDKVWSEEMKDRGLE